MKTPKEHFEDYYGCLFDRCNNTFDAHDMVAFATWITSQSQSQPVSNSSHWDMVYIPNNNKKDFIAADKHMQSKLREPQPVSVSEEVKNVILKERDSGRMTEATYRFLMRNISTHQPTKIDEDCNCINCDQKKETHNICSDCLHEIINENKLPTKIDEGEMLKFLTKREKDGSYYEILKYKKERIGINNLLVPYDAAEDLAKAIAKLINGGTE